MIRAILLLAFSMLLSKSILAQNMDFEYEKVIEFTFNNQTQVYDETAAFEAKGAISIDDFNITIKGYNG